MILTEQLSFSAGEWSPRLWHRHDLAKYASGCRILENFIPTAAGSAIRRPGTDHLMDVPFTGSAPLTGRMVPLQIETDHHLVLVLSDGLASVTADGAVVLDDEDAPVTIAIPWADADLPRLKWKQINDIVYFAHADYAPYRLIRRADDDWTLEAVPFGVDAPMLPTNGDEGKIVSLTYSGSVTPAAWASATIYAAGSRVTYSGKTYVCQADHTSQADGGPQSPVGEKPTTGTYAFSVFDGRQWYQIQKPLWIELVLDNPIPTGQEVVLTTDYQLFDAAHVGSVWRFDRRRAATEYETTLAMTTANNGAYSKAIEIQGAWNFATNGNWYGTLEIYLSEDNGSTWKKIRSYTSSATVPRNVSDSGTETKRVLMRIRYSETSAGSSTPYALLSAVEADIKGWVRITSVESPGEAHGEALSHLQTMETHRWAEGAWSDYQGYPRCVELHQSRLVYAGTAKRPHTVWGSAEDDYAVFSGGGLATDSYAHTLVIGERDPINWLISDRFLMIGSGAAEFIMFGKDENSPITPEDRNVRRQSTLGCDDRGACATPSETVPLFIQRGGDRIQELRYVYDDDRFAASNICLMADHLHRGKVIAELALQRVPHQILWVVDTAGNLTAHTYERGHDVAGWHRHVSDGATFKGVAVCRGGDSEDHVYLLVVRGGTLSLERLGRGNLAAPDISQTWTDATATLADPDAISDADRLNGVEVAACWNGLHWIGTWTSGMWSLVTGIMLRSTEDFGGKYYPGGLYGGFAKWVKVGQHSLGDLADFIATVDGRVTVYSGGAPVAYLGTGATISGGESILDVSGAVGSLGTVAIVTANPASLGRDAEWSTLDGTWWAESIDGSGRVVYRSTAAARTLQYESHSGTNKWTQRAAVSPYTVLFIATTGSDDLENVAWQNALTSAPSDGVFSFVGEDPGTAMKVGRPYSATLEPMPLQLQVGNGTSRSRELRIHKVVPDVEASYGGWIGPTLEKLQPIHDDFQSHDGDREMSFTGGYETTGDLFVVADQPAPFILRGLTIKFNVYGDQG